MAPKFHFNFNETVSEMYLEFFFPFRRQGEHEYFRLEGLKLVSVACLCTSSMCLKTRRILQRILSDGPSSICDLRTVTCEQLRVSLQHMLVAMFAPFLLLLVEAAIDFWLLWKPGSVILSLHPAIVWRAVLHMSPSCSNVWMSSKEVTNFVFASMKHGKREKKRMFWTEIVFSPWFMSVTCFTLSPSHPPSLLLLAAAMLGLTGLKLVQKVLDNLWIVGVLRRKKNSSGGRCIVLFTQLQLFLFISCFLQKGVKFVCWGHGR